MSTCNALCVVLVLVLTSGCTSLTPVEMPPDQLHEKIRVQGIIKTGDRVKVVTRDGKQHRFRVDAIKGDIVLGRNVSIRIDTIIALETRQFSGGKTSMLVGGTLLWMYVILLSLSVVLAI